MKLQTDLREFVELLNSRNVEFLVVGGHAVAFHGHPRFTGDIDIFVRRSDANAARVVSALIEFGFGGVGIDVQTLTTADTVVQLGRPPNRIDLLTSIAGVEFDEVWAGRIGAEMDGVPVYFPSRDSLLKNKRAAGRPKDMADVAALDPTNLG